MTCKLLVLALLPCTGVLAQNPVRIALEPFATGLAAPVKLAHCGDDRLFVNEQSGKIRIVSPSGTVSPTPFLNITDRVNDSGGEQGLLGLAFDPDYAENGEFYVFYTAGTNNGTNRISRFHVTADPNVADPESEEIIYEIVDLASNHNGGDITFGPDGYLYCGFGDAGSADDPWNHAQTLTDNAFGDMIRIDVHGEAPYTIPPTNPWADMGNDTLPEIWASGLRNPWRIGFDAVTGDLWIGDVGQNAWEEVDFWPAGNNSGPNFGWRCREGLVECPSSDTEGCPDASAFVDPVSVHSHSSGWCSVIGGRVYRGQDYPRLYGRYIYTDYCPAPYYSLTPDEFGGFTRAQIMPAGGVGASCIAENNLLELFVANVENGTIKRIVDLCPMAAPVISQAGDVLTSTFADSYTWYFNGEEIPNATTQSITIDEVGEYYVVAGFEPSCELQSETVEVIQLGVVSLGTATFQVYPSPARDMVMLSDIPAEASSVRITDLTGRTMTAQSINRKPRITVDVSSFANANYLISLLAADGTALQQRKLLVQH
ncbi:MAG TPA: PQQ-dependent sugar dehydrogenase [Flavobacteriales bacterium]|nr:PQQ-dependent sugar dehydrogenase [Flavobacteriales bacterium]